MLACEFTLLRDAWTVAIETFSWIEMRRLNERAALMRTVKQLGVKDPSAIRFAYGLVVELNVKKSHRQIHQRSGGAQKNQRVQHGHPSLPEILRLPDACVKNWGKVNLKEAGSSQHGQSHTWAGRPW